MRMFGVVSSVVISSAARVPGMPANRLPPSIMTNPCYAGINPNASASSV